MGVRSTGDFAGYFYDQQAAFTTLVDLEMGTAYAGVHIAPRFR